MSYLLPSRSALPSSSESARVRARAGITQAELGLLLGVGKGQVCHVEAGRRGYSARAQARLTRLGERLLQPVPAAPPGAGAPAAPPAGPTPAEQAALRRRLRDCRRTLAGLRYAEAGRPPLAAALARRTQALADLRAALAAETTPTPGTDPARDQAWVELLTLATTRVARRQPTPTARAWTALRQQLLAAEIAGLEALLAG